MKPYEIFIPCRVNSNRLPYKHFRTLGEVTVIEYLIIRLMELTDAQLNIVCPDNSANDIYLELENLYPVTVFRGDEEDVLDRFLKAVRARKNEARYAVRINGDCVVPSAEILSSLDAQMAQPEHDIYTTVGTNVPSGQHIEAVRISWLLAQSELLSKASVEEREHVFPLIYTLCTNVGKLELPTPHKTKLSIDTYRDLERVRHIISQGSRTAEIDRVAQNFDKKNLISGENGVYLIAEIGGNHEGEFDYAKKLVSDACATEVDAIKLQIYSPDLLVNSKLAPVRWKHFSRFALSSDQYTELFNIIRDSGKHTCASVWSLEELEQHAANIDVLKVGSGDLNNAPMLRALAALDKPLVISCGLATVETAEHAYRTILETGFDLEKLAVLQCTSMYPIPDVEANLLVIQDFQRQMKCRIGYSDHTVSYQTLLDSVSAGARVLEFHFSDDTSNVGFRDHLVSLDKDDIAELVAGIRQRLMRLGSKTKRLTFLERSRNHQVSFRKGVFLRHNIRKGHVVTESDLIALRPLEGIDATQFYDVVGRMARQDIAALDALSWKMFDGKRS